MNSLPCRTHELIREILYRNVETSTSCEFFIIHIFFLSFNYFLPFHSPTGCDCGWLWCKVYGEAQVAGGIGTGSEIGLMQNKNEILRNSNSLNATKEQKKEQKLIIKLKIPQQTKDKRNIQLNYLFIWINHYES